MSDERLIYADNEYLSDLSMNWEQCCRTVFVDADLHCRPVAEVHPVIRQWATEHYGDNSPPAMLRYLLAPAGQVRRRLHLQGYTPRSIRELWTRAHARHVSRMGELAAEFSDGAFWSEVQALQHLSFEAWAEQQVREFDYEHHMRFGGVFNVDLIDPFADLALHIDMRKPEAVWMDLTDLYADEFDVRLSVRENLAHRNAEFDLIETGGDILVLTEGSSDARILKAAIAAMYPEFADLFGFVDFDEFKVEGGASLLVKMVKAFAGVRMEQRIIALFDNDAAGIEAKRSLDRIRLPSSIRTMVLPDAAIARNYLTLGPEGLRTMDVNGSACPIEMFLGEEALTGPDGRLRPVRWSSWNKNAERYQGEIEDKSAATDVFLKSLAGGHVPRELRKRFPEMDRLLSELFEAFSVPEK